MAEINRAWVLEQRPVGTDFDSALKFRELPVPDIADGQVLIRTLYLSLDPANRGWMAGPTYMPAVPLGVPMWGGILGRVVQSKSDKYQPGDIVGGFGSWSDYCALPADGLNKIPDTGLPLAASQALFGGAGGTAYIGTLDVGQVKAGQTFVVSGAAGSVGSLAGQIAKIHGAKVIGIDRPQELEALNATLAPFSGRALALDVTAPDAGEQIAKAAGSVDIMVHNAGVTRDKMLRNMPEHLWDMVMAINLEAIININERLLAGALAPQARIVCISSMNGIAGSAGQTNYAATKSGVFTYAATQAAAFAARGYAVNAIAPGFIETQMTAAIPPINRFVGRRIASLSQGGLPEDIAEAVTFFGSAPLSGGINGACLRVCGQNWLGA